MTSSHNRTNQHRRLSIFIASLCLALVSPVWAITLEPDLGRALPVNFCTMIYPADVAKRTYHIVSPGKYCLAADLNATQPAAAPTNALPIPGQPTRSPSNPMHSGAAIHLHASDVEVSFGGYALNDSGRTRIDEGIRIEPGLSNVYVHGGLVNGFQVGLSGQGEPSLTLSGIRIQRMQFYGNAIGVALGTIRDSNISQSTFAADIMGFALTNADTTVVTGNRFDLSVNGEYWAAGLYSYWGARNLTISDNVFNGRGRPGGVGIFLHNNTRQAANEELSRDNRVERNLLYAVQIPIQVVGSGVARNNLIRQNQIYGDTIPSIVRTYPASFPAQFTGIRVDLNENVEISGNYIFTGHRVPYYNGIALRDATTVKRDGNGGSLLRFNQTCGVADSLVPPPGVPESSIDDGNNYWNLFCLPPVIE